MNPEETTAKEGTTEQSAPKSTPSISIPAAIVTGATIIGLAIIFTMGPSTGTTKPPTTTPGTPSEKVASDIATIRPQDYVNGNKNAEIVVIEYSDSDCPFCKQFHETMKVVTDTYKGKVAWIYRFFPLTSLHPNAYTEAMSLNCAGELGGNDAFWKYMDTVIGVTLNNDAKSNEALATFAVQSGVDNSLFRACMSKKNDPRVDADIAEAQTIGARGTPYNIVINRKTGEQSIIPGAAPLESVKQTIDALLR